MSAPNAAFCGSCGSFTVQVGTVVSPVATSWRVKSTRSSQTCISTTSRLVAVFRWLPTYGSAYSPSPPASSAVNPPCQIERTSRGEVRPPETATTPGKRSRNWRIDPPSA